MNSSSITGAASPLTPQFEATRPDELPSVPEIDPAEDLETSPSDEHETEAGLLRLVDFIKKKKNDRYKKGVLASQAYENAKNYKDESAIGMLLNRIR